MLVDKSIRAMESDQDTNFKTLKISNADKGIYMYTYW